MPIKLDNTDKAIIEALTENGRKSFRQIARETGITTPTAEARFDRLINIGFLKSVSPIFDCTKIEKNANLELNKNTIRRYANNKSKFGENMKVKLQCELCEGSVSGEAHVLKKSTEEGYNHFRYEV